MSAQTAERNGISFERMVSAVEKVEHRLLRTARALEAAGIPYAIAGGNAVAAWVTTVDEAAVRNTRDVDVLIRRADFDRVVQTLEAEGFTYRHLAGVDVLLDAPGGSVRDAVHLIFASEKVRAHEPAAKPDVVDSVAAERFRVLSLEALVHIKLTAFRDKDRTHLRDMLEVGLIDESWCNRLSDELSARLRRILDTPEG